MDKMGDARVILAIKGIIGLVVKVGSRSLNQTSKPRRVLSSCCFVRSVRDDTWVIIVMHQVVTTMVSLVIWKEIVRTTIIMESLVILLEIILNKERLNRSRVMPEYML